MLGSSTEAPAKLKISDINFTDIVTHIQYCTGLPDDDAILGAQILISKSDRFVYLEDTFTKNFITQCLPDLIKNRKSQPIVLKTSQELILEQDIQNVDPNPATLVFTKSKLETTNVAKFMALSNPLRQSIKDGKRVNKFVITLGEPNLPRRHPGVDDTYHPDKNMDYEHEDLLQRGSTTLLLVDKLFKDGTLCPELIFLRGAISADDDQLTKTIHTKHTLEYYQSNIENENQRPFEFHFAGHGNDELLGPMTTERRITPEELAVRFDQMLTSCGLRQTLIEKSTKKKDPQQLIFKFHSCNSAYAQTVCEGDSAEAIKMKVLNTSAIGRFSKAMVALGYKNFKVGGYRGFYQAYEGGAGLCFSERLNDPQLKIIGEKTLHEIECKDGATKVSLPADSKYATFQVVLPPKQHLRATQ